MGPVPDTNTDKEMNEPTASVKATPLEGREARAGLGLQKRIYEFGAGAGRRASQNLAFVTGNIWLVAAAPTLAGCSEKLLSSLTPFKKQEENISSV